MKITADDTSKEWHLLRAPTNLADCHSLLLFWDRAWNVPSFSRLSSIIYNHTFHLPHGGYTYRYHLNQGGLLNCINRAGKSWTAEDRTNEIIKI